MYKYVNGADDEYEADEHEPRDPLPYMEYIKKRPHNVLLVLDNTHSQAH